MKKAIALFLTTTEQNINKTTINKLHSASGRLQIRPAANACLKSGLDVKSMLPNCFNSDAISLNDKPIICFVGKISAKTSDEKIQSFTATLAAIASLKAQNIPIACIYSDHFEGKEKLVQEFYKTVLSLATCTIFPSKLLADLALPFLRKNNKRFVIYDPCQIKQIQFPGKIQAEARLIWFGNDSNVKYLIQFLERIHPIGEHSYELTILASTYALSFYKEFFNNVSARLSWKIRPIEWNLDQQPFQLEMELERAQISLITSDPSDPRKAGVSHNRLTDSIQGGCITIASPMESYKKLSRVAILGEDFESLIPIAISQSERLSEKYEKLRPTHLEDFSETRNSAKWREVVTYLLSINKSSDQ